MGPHQAQSYSAVGLCHRDFRGAGFSRTLHERYGLRELELARHGVFKSEKGVVLDMNLTERIAAARFAPQLGRKLGPCFVG